MGSIDRPPWSQAFSLDLPERFILLGSNCIRALLGELKREPRENRGRARRCYQGQNPQQRHCFFFFRRWEGAGFWMIWKSEDLPGQTKGRKPCGSLWSFAKNRGQKRARNDDLSFRFFCLKRRAVVFEGNSGRRKRGSPCSNRPSLFRRTGLLENHFCFFRCFLQPPLASSFFISTRSTIPVLRRQEAGIICAFFFPLK